MIAVHHGKRWRRWRKWDNEMQRLMGMLYAGDMGTDRVQRLNRACANRARWEHREWWADQMEAQCGVRPQVATEQIGGVS